MEDRRERERATQYVAKHMEIIENRWWCEWIQAAKVAFAGRCYCLFFILYFSTNTNAHTLDAHRLSKLVPRENFNHHAHFLPYFYTQTKHMRLTQHMLQHMFIIKLQNRAVFIWSLGRLWKWQLQNNNNTKKNKHITTTWSTEAIKLKKLFINNVTRQNECF